MYNGPGEQLGSSHRYLGVCACQHAQTSLLMQPHLSPAAVIFTPLPDYCHDSVMNLIVWPGADTIRL